jgi:hypothetical protein
MIILLIFILQAFAQCPKDTLRVEYFSPSENKNKIVCQKQVDGKYITIKDISDEKIAEVAPQNSSTLNLDLNNYDMLFKIINLMTDAVTLEINCTEMIYKISGCNPKYLKNVKLGKGKDDFKLVHTLDDQCKIDSSFRESIKEPVIMKYLFKETGQLDKLNVDFKFICDPKKTDYLETLMEGTISSTQVELKIIFQAKLAEYFSPISGKMINNEVEYTLVSINGQTINFSKKYSTKDKN